MLCYLRSQGREATLHRIQQLIHDELGLRGGHMAIIRIQGRVTREAGPEPRVSVFVPLGPPR